MSNVAQNELTMHCVNQVPYRGYVAIWCGDGTMIFKGPKGDEVKGISESREGWMDPAWQQVKAAINSRTSTAI